MQLYLPTNAQLLSSMLATPTSYNHCAAWQLGCALTARAEHVFFIMSTRTLQERISTSTSISTEEVPNINKCFSSITDLSPTAKEMLTEVSNLPSGSESIGCF
jgi:hypothetical protein